MVKSINVYDILVRKRERKNHLEDLDIDGKIILEFMLRNWSGICGLDSSGSG
jgi:hypothetical protein